MAVEEEYLKEMHKYCTCGKPWAIHGNQGECPIVDGMKIVGHTDQTFTEAVSQGF